MRTKLLAAVTAFAVLLGNAAQAQKYNAPVHNLAPEVQKNVDLAYLLLNGDLGKDRLNQLLIGGGVIPGKPPLGEIGPGVTVAPFAAFDQLYYFGMNTVGAWALKTSDGIILFDTLNNTEEAQRIIEGGMKAMSLDPATIKHIVIMHAHADHFGGAKYLQDKYHPAVWMAPADWDVMAAQAKSPNRRPNAVEPPKRDKDVVDGQSLTLGGTTVKLYITPGHTPGTVSAFIPVTDKGQPHTLAFWGGTGLPRSLAPTAVNGGLDRYQNELIRYAKLGIDAKVDGLIANHAISDGTVEKAAEMQSRKAGDPNPYIFGQASFARIMGSFIAAVEAARLSASTKVTN